MRSNNSETQRTGNARQQIEVANQIDRHEKACEFLPPRDTDRSLAGELTRKRAKPGNLLSVGGRIGGSLLVVFLAIVLTLANTVASVGINAETTMKRAQTDT